MTTTKLAKKLAQTSEWQTALNKIMLAPNCEELEKLAEEFDLKTLHLDELYEVRMRDLKLARGKRK